MTKQQASFAVTLILEDIHDRKGLGDALDEMDDDIQKEMIEHWVDLIRQVANDDL